MTITNYTDLTNAVGRWLHRSDLADAAPDFVMLAETRLNRNLRVRQMEKRLTVTASSETIALPDDWLEFVGSPMAGDVQFTFVARDRWNLNVERRITGSYYTIIGNELLVGHDFAAPDDISFSYYAKIPALSETETENWLLRDAPDVYLYGSLIEAEPYLKNDSRIEVWRAFLQVGLTDLQVSSDRAKYSGGTLVIGAPQ